MTPCATWRRCAARTLGLLEATDLGESGDALLADGFVYELVLRHEQQHSETILQTLQIMTTEPYEPPARRGSAPAGRLVGEMAFVPGGPFEMGAPARGFAYDNERPRHASAVGPFLIDRVPVTNGGMLEFIEDGGYCRPELWGDAGWAWRTREGVGHAPLLGAPGQRLRGAFLRAGAATRRHAPGVPRVVARGRRLRALGGQAAADGDRMGEGRRLGPRGRRQPATALGRRGPPTNGSRTWASSASAAPPAGAYSGGESACGMRQAAGDVWEWTASGFDGYPGFRAFPYREYSEEFFGGPYRVLRGGSWATQPDAVSNTFRNWDHPERRQIFAGFRCAANVEEQA